MSHECNSSGTGIIEVSEGVEIVTKHVEKIDDYSSKFKGIYLKYNLNRDRYDFIDEVYFFAPTPSNVENTDICSEIILNLPITKVYRVQIPGFPHPDRDILIKIIVKHVCEYKRNSKTVRESQYEIPFAGN
ncbi:MAG: hypothetical protein ACYTBX_07705 [Planctomycetota bacterium]|jgi:hypothetical protein